MKIEDFRAIVKELLVEGWGEQIYPPIQLNRLWQLVKDCHAGEFRYALDGVNMQARKAPSLAEIRAACQPIIAKAREDQKREKLRALAATAPCRQCGNSGWVYAYRAVRPDLIFTFICSCEAVEIMRIGPGKGAQFWRDASADETLLLRSLDDRGEREWRGHLEAWYQARGLRPCSDNRKLVEGL